MITVYYDGLCHLCSREILHYRKQAGQDQIIFVDITDDAFDAAAENLDSKKIHEAMHVRKSSGQIATGIDAFITIWQTLPNYHWLARLAKISLVRAMLVIGYNVFAKIRPYLPRKTKDCETSPYCEIKKKDL